MMLLILKIDFFRFECSTSSYSDCNQAVDFEVGDRISIQFISKNADGSPVEKGSGTQY